MKGTLQRKFFSDASLGLEFMGLASGWYIDLVALDGGFSYLLDGRQRFGLGKLSHACTSSTF